MTHALVRRSLCTAAIAVTASAASAVGTWTRVTASAPHTNGGVMLVLSDGTVLCKTYAGGADAPLAMMNDGFVTAGDISLVLLFEGACF